MGEEARRVCGILGKLPADCSSRLEAKDTVDLPSIAVRQLQDAAVTRDCPQRGEVGGVQPARDCSFSSNAAATSPVACCCHAGVNANAEPIFGAVGPRARRRVRATAAAALRPPSTMSTS